MTAMILSDRYELGAIIGTGGMSDVYEANDTLLGRSVAVKMLRPELARDVKFKERFRREAQNSGRLNHSAIVQVYDTGEIDISGTAVPFIVMELVHGRTLRDIVREEGAFSPADAARILVTACEALQASHDAGIIHRDIKPANIMITNTGAVKVMDFGIARALDDSHSAMTQTSAVIGTAQYLSPEQARGKMADARSDVYSIGCVFYEMITARPPFEGESPFAIAYQHVQEDPNPPSDFIADLSPTAALNIDAVALTAMAKHPADRYQSAAEFAEDLKRVSRNAVSQAARSHLTTTDAPRRGAGAAAGAAGAAGAAALGGAADTAATQIVPVAGAGVPSSEQAYPATEVVPPIQPTGASSPVDYSGGTYNNGYENGYSTDYNDGNDDGYEEDEPKKRSAATWIIALFTVLALCVGGYFAWDYIGQGLGLSSKTEKVPDVSGQKEDEAKAKLEKLGYHVEVVQQTNPDVERGVAIKTNPAAGSSVQSSATVTLFISSGKEVTEVPDLTGKTTEEASRLLEESGLELDPVVKEEESDTVDDGAVVSQNPSAGSQVSKGTKVVITVSTGKAQVRVPTITGMKWEQAQDNITSIGLNPRVANVDSDQPEGTVVGIDGEGTSVDKGSTVIVRVSNGQMIKAPSLIGLNVSQALDALRAAGWQGSNNSLHQQQVRTGALLDQGKIANQSPNGGALVRKDGTVTVGVFVFDLLAVQP